jgi:hypothetical protein
MSFLGDNVVVASRNTANLLRQVDIDIPAHFRAHLKARYEGVTLGVFFS